MSWTRVLLVAGAAFEIWGLALLAKGLRELKQEGHKLARRGVRVRLFGAASAEGAGSVTVSGGRPPTIEERLRTVESRVAALGEQMREGDAKIRKDLDQLMQERLQNLVEDEREERRKLEDALSRLLSTRRDAWGIVLFVFGLALSVASGWISA